MSQALSTDVLIVGGGIAGLWLNARLRRQGFATLLVENARLGGGQSVKSQGIIHGGAKYALHGALTGASEAIADMPRRWREALAGSGELDLAGVRLLSDAHYLWSPGSLAGNITSFFASKAVRGRVDQVKGEQLPPARRPEQTAGGQGRAGRAGGGGRGDPRPAHRPQGRPRQCRAARGPGSEPARTAAAAAAYGAGQGPDPETAVRPLPGRRAEAASHRHHSSGRRRRMGLVPGRRFGRSRGRGP